MVELRQLVRWLMGDFTPQPGPGADVEPARPGFISSRPLFSVSDELVRKLEEAGAGDRIRDPVTKGPLDVFLLDPGLGPATFLTRDGRVVWEDDWGVAPVAAQAYAGIIVGAKKTGVRELLELLPDRPDACEDCADCRATGWFDLGDVSPEAPEHPLRFVCPKCGGLGWRRDIVSVPADTAAWIAARIESFGEEAPANRRWLAPHVVQHGAFPLLLEWTETLGIKPDGSLIRWSTEGEYDGARPVDDAHDRHVVLAVASKEHRELAGIAPVRTEGALICRGCIGTGAIEGGPELLCLCGGLGWIPRELEGLQERLVPRAERS